MRTSYPFSSGSRSNNRFRAVGSGGATVQRRAGSAALDFGVEIICETCYIKGAASTSLTIQGNPASIISNYTAEIAGTVKNVTDVVVDKLAGAIKQTVKNVVDDIFDGPDDDNPFQFPTIDVDFDLDLAPLPGVTVQFQFDDDLEIYMRLNSKLAAGATYTLNLFSSVSPLGVAIGSDITAGVAVVIDLILDVRTAIDISSGFHLRLDKGVGMKLDMFSPNVSDLAL